MTRGENRTKKEALQQIVQKERKKEKGMIPAESRRRHSLAAECRKKHATGGGVFVDRHDRTNLNLFFEVVCSVGTSQ
jgi:hypothetical protein